LWTETGGQPGRPEAEIQIPIAPVLYLGRAISFVTNSVLIGAVVALFWSVIRKHLFGGEAN